MQNFKNEVYSLVDEEFMSNFKGRHLDFMKEFYYNEYCDEIGRKSLTINEFYTNMHKRRIQLYQMCCPSSAHLEMIANSVTTKLNKLQVR